MKYKIRCVKLLVRTIRTSISKQFTYAVIEVTALDLPWGVMQYPPPPPPPPPYPPPPPPIPSPKFVPPTTQNTARVWKADPQRGCRCQCQIYHSSTEGAGKLPRGAKCKKRSHGQWKELEDGHWSCSSKSSQIACSHFVSKCHKEQTR